MDDIDRIVELGDDLVNAAVKKIKSGLRPPVDRNLAEPIECEDCGKEISAARLLAMPATKRCVVCQSSTERRR
jgi:RNA polymerase-binding transcription factor DksA